MLPRYITPLLACAALCAPLPLRAQLLDFRGGGWSSGRSPHLAVGDSIFFALRADAVSSVIRFDLDQEELTLWIRALVQRTVVFQGVPINECTGLLYAFRDPARNSDFGVNPPNPTVPATFDDGGLVWKVPVRSLSLICDEASAAGALEVPLFEFAVDELGAPVRWDRGGRTLIGVLQYGDLSMPGYDFSIDAVVDETIFPGYTWLRRFELTAWSFDTTGAGTLQVQGEFQGYGPPGIDPSQSEVGVGVGGWWASLPTWAVARQPLAAAPTWKWTAPGSGSGLKVLCYQFLGDASWRFEMRVAGIPLQELLLPDRRLLVRMFPVAWYYGEDDVPFDGSPGDSTTDFRRAIDLRRRLAAWRATPCSPPVPRSRRDVAAHAVSVHDAVPAQGVVQVFDVAGRLVRTLPRNANSTAPESGWDRCNAAGQHVPRGVYFIRRPALAEAPVERILIR